MVVAADAASAGLLLRFRLLLLDALPPPPLSNVSLPAPTPALEEARTQEAGTVTDRALPWGGWSGATDCLADESPQGGRWVGEALEVVVRDTGGWAKFEEVHVGVLHAQLPLVAVSSPELHGDACQEVRLRLVVQARHAHSEDADVNLQGVLLRLISPSSLTTDD